MRKIVLVIILASIVFSCDNSSKKLVELENQNKQLKEELLILKGNIDKYKFMPFVYPKKSKIRLGESYEAAFLIGLYNDENPPLITVHNSNEPNIIDTLIYNKDERGSIFSYKPKTKGHYIYFAKMIILTIKKDTVSFPIRWEFDVE